MGNFNQRECNLISFYDIPLQDGASVRPELPRLEILRRNTRATPLSVRIPPMGALHTVIVEPVGEWLKNKSGEQVSWDTGTITAQHAVWWFCSWYDRQRTSREETRNLHCIYV